MENNRLIGGIDAVRLSLQTTETNARVANARQRGELFLTGTSKRPDSFVVKYTIDDQPFTEAFKNQ